MKENTMTITIDMLQSYQPIMLGNKKYWKRGSTFYTARINSFGLVELEEAVLIREIKQSA